MTPVIRVISTADIARCPAGSLLPAHYRDNGTCLHFTQATHRMVTPKMEHAAKLYARWLRAGLAAEAARRALDSALSSMPAEVMAGYDDLTAEIRRTITEGE